MFNLAINDIFQKRDLEKYVFSDNLVIAYYATAFADHNLLYLLIEIGSTQQKINVIEHGSSKHIKILLNDDDPIIRDRAIKRAANLEKNIYHEYVTSEKIDLLLRPYTTKKQLDFFERELNIFVGLAYRAIKERDELLYIMTNEEFNEMIISIFILSEDEQRKRIEE